jgi:DNA-binding transcriptional MerR regulator
MASPVGKIDELIAASQARLDDAQQKLQKAEQRVKETREVVRDIEAELRGLNSARDTLSGSPSGRQRSNDARPRGVSSTWKSILQFIGSKSEVGASIDEIEAYVTTNNLEVQRGAIRSQLSNYKQRGALQTVGDAQYKLTQQGEELLAQPEAQ